MLSSSKNTLPLLKVFLQRVHFMSKNQAIFEELQNFPSANLWGIQNHQKKSTVRARLIAGKQRKVMRIRSISFYVQKRLSNYEQTHEETSTTSVLNTDTLYV